MAPVSLLVTALTTLLAVHSVQASPAASAAPSNPNGPYSNPYDKSSQPVTWPGKPTEGQSTPTSRPGPAYTSGGLPQYASKYHGPAWLPKGSSSLVAALPTGVQNGHSPWGIIDKPGLPCNLPGKGPKYSTVVKRPTTTLTSGQTPTSGPCGKAPDTGVTRTYDFHVSYQTIAPDGVKKNGLVINGGFPGPLIEANWGDWVKSSLSHA